jgi:hypothetical protein
VLGFVFALGWEGCTSAVMPRTADVLGRRELAFSTHLPMGAYAPGRVGIEDERGSHLAAGNSGSALAPGHLLIMTGFLAGIELGVRAGLGAGCEAGLMLGYVRVGAEVRCAVVDEDSGQPLSVAVAGAGGYSFRGDGGFARLGLDVSRRFGTSGPLLNLALSRGPEVHQVNLDVPSYDSHSGAVAEVVRDELRWTSLVGYGFHVPQPAQEHVGTVYLGVAPYFTLRAEEPRRLECHACLPEARLTSFDEDWGIVFVVGGGVLSAAPWKR